MSKVPKISSISSPRSTSGSTPPYPAIKGGARGVPPNSRIHLTRWAVTALAVSPRTQESVTRAHQGRAGLGPQVMRTFGVPDAVIDDD
jgi:hypothetical protein